MCSGETWRAEIVVEEYDETCKYTDDVNSPEQRFDVKYHSHCHPSCSEDRCEVHQGAYEVKEERKNGQTGKESDYGAENLDMHHFCLSYRSTNPSDAFLDECYEVTVTYETKSDDVTTDLTSEQFYLTYNMDDYDDTTDLGIKDLHITCYTDRQPSGKSGGCHIDLNCNSTNAFQSLDDETFV